MHQHFVLVCYDLPDDKRRARLHKHLLAFGSPVQYSVFECLVTERELARLQRSVARIIKPRLDHVRYYFLCAACQGRIISTQAGRNAVQERSHWVV